MKYKQEGLCSFFLIVGIFLGGVVVSIRSNNLLAAKDIQIRGLNRLVEDVKYNQEVWKRLATKDYRPMPEREEYVDE